MKRVGQSQPSADVALYADRFLAGNLILEASDAAGNRRSWSVPRLLRRADGDLDPADFLGAATSHQWTT